MKKMVVFSSSERVNGNSKFLAQTFAKGAADAGNEVEFVNLREYDLHFCKGCYGCTKTLQCVQDDGVGVLLDKLLVADVIVFASPVYFYAISGLLKTFLDRTLPLYYVPLKNKAVYAVLTAGENEASAVEGALKDIHGWIECFEGVELKGSVCGIGLYECGAAKGSPFEEEAYRMGHSI